MSIAQKQGNSALLGLRQNPNGSFSKRSPSIGPCTAKGTSVRGQSLQTVDRIWPYVYGNKIPIYPIFYLLKGDQHHIGTGIVIGMPSGKQQHEGPGGCAQAQQLLATVALNQGLGGQLCHQIPSEKGAGRGPNELRGRTAGVGTNHVGDHWEHGAGAIVGCQGADSQQGRQRGLAHSGIAMSPCTLASFDRLL